MTEFKVNEYEIKALRMLAGEIPIQGGAWLNACCEFLEEAGFVTRIPYQPTQRGLDFLKELRHD